MNRQAHACAHTYAQPFPETLFLTHHIGRNGRAVLGTVTIVCAELERMRKCRWWAFSALQSIEMYGGSLRSSRTMCFEMGYIMM